MIAALASVCNKMCNKRQRAANEMGEKGRMRERKENVEWERVRKLQRNGMTHTERETKTSDCDLSLFSTGILFICSKNCCWFSDATETHARFCGYYDFLCVCLSFFLRSAAVVFKRLDLLLCCACVSVCVYFVFLWLSPSSSSLLLLMLLAVDLMCSKTLLSHILLLNRFFFVRVFFRPSVSFHSFHRRTRFQRRFRGANFSFGISFLFFFPLWFAVWSYIYFKRNRS